MSETCVACAALRAVNETEKDSEDVAIAMAIACAYFAGRIAESEGAELEDSFCTVHAEVASMVVKNVGVMMLQEGNDEDSSDK